MRFSVKISLLVLILLTSGFSSFAQEYLVTNKADTIRGQVKILNFGSIDQAQVIVDKKKTTYVATEIRTLYIDGEFYKPMKQFNFIRFMKVLKTGYLSLYAFRPENMMTYDGRFLAKIDGQSMEVPNIGFKKILSKFLMDCDIVVARIQSGEYGRGDIDTIIDTYNACITNKTSASFTRKAEVTETKPADSNKLQAVKNLQSKVESAEMFAGKKDVTDLLVDIADKVSKQQSVPNYQLEALKGYLKDNTQTKEELDNLLAALGAN